MINNIEEIILEILDKATNKNLKVKILKENNYLIENKDLNVFLNILFEICSKNDYCFNIIRKELDSIKIEIFHNLSFKEVLINISFLEEIKKEKVKYSIKYHKYQKNKIYPIIGPDGVGKTTLLTSTIDIKRKNILYKRFKKIVRRSFIYNLLYPINRIFLKRKLGKKPEKDQHDDTHYLLVILAGVFYYPYLIFYSKFRKKTVFIDRFFNDYLFENISFLEKETILRKNWKKLLNLFPTVFWMIHLDAKPEIILNRKKELTKNDIEKYKEYNFKIYLEKPSFIYSYINTSLNLEECKYVLNNTYKRIILQKG